MTKNRFYNTKKHKQFETVDTGTNGKKYRKRIGNSFHISVLDLRRASNDFSLSDESDFTQRVHMDCNNNSIGTMILVRATGFFDFCYFDEQNPILKHYTVLELPIEVLFILCLHSMSTPFLRNVFCRFRIRGLCLRFRNN